MSEMAGLEIQSAVSSINAAFVSVRDFLASLRRYSPQGRSDAKPYLADEAVRLQKVLKRAPKAIEEEYAGGIAAHGKRFQKGDGQIAPGSSGFTKRLTRACI